MKVLNVHKRQIKRPKKDVLELFHTLATSNDKIWPVEYWPPVKFEEGIRPGSTGGHGPIRYQVVEYNPESHIEFRFQKPKGFNGIHTFRINKLTAMSTEIIHKLEMTTSVAGTVLWYSMIRWLHDALIEDAFDNIENQLLNSNLKTKWSYWVKFCRWLMQSKKYSINKVKTWISV